MASASSRALREVISHQTRILSRAASASREARSLIDACETDVLRLLASEDDEPLGRGGTDRLAATIRDVVSEHYAEVATHVESVVSDLALYEGEWTRDLLRRVLPDESPATASGDELGRAGTAVPFRGRYLAEWTRDLREGATRRLRDVVRIGMVEGLRPTELSRRIRGTAMLRRRDGETEKSRRGAESLIRTAVAHTVVWSREQVLRKNPRLVTGVVWVSTLDSGTTPVCASRSGHVYRVGSGPRPPAHWGCRSTTSPVLLGEVPDIPSLDEWLAQLSAAEQDEILGPTRGRLRREGGLPASRMTTSSGRELTLRELRQRDSAAFTRAGLAE